MKNNLIPIHHLCGVIQTTGTIEIKEDLLSFRMKKGSMKLHNFWENATIEKTDGTRSGYFVHMLKLDYTKVL